MTTPKIVAVAFPNAIEGVYDYAVPDRLAAAVACGVPVLVAIRSRNVWGMVVEEKDHSPYPSLKEVQEVKTGMNRQTFTGLITLYRWIAG